MYDSCNSLIILIINIIILIINIIIICNALYIHLSLLMKTHLSGRNILNFIFYWHDNWVVNLHFYLTGALRSMSSKAIQWAGYFRFAKVSNLSADLSCRAQGAFLSQLCTLVCKAAVCHCQIQNKPYTS